MWTSHRRMMDGRVLCFLLMSAIFSNAESHVSTIANDFVFTIFNADVNGDSVDFLLLAIVSNNNNGTANVIVTSPYSSFNTIRVSVASYSVLKIPITPESIQDQYQGNFGPDGPIVVEDKGIRVQSDLPVAVIAHTEALDGGSADSFLVIPAVHLGTQYVAVTSTQPYESSPNMIAVVAYQNNTQVTIGTQTVTLHELQVASVASISVLSGTVINGNKPFGVITGCTCGFVSNNNGGCDYEAVMLLPVSVWGTEFTAIPFMNLSLNYYQVVANTNNTVVSAEGTTVAALNANEYHIFSIGAALVTSNYPIQLIQLGQNTGGQHDDMGDPFFLQLPSTDKMSNASVLFQPTGFMEDYGVDLVFFLRIVTNLAGTSTIQLDNTTISAAQFKQIPNSKFYYYESTALNTTHSVTTNNSGTQYSVISYTYGMLEGCGFVCAYDLTNNDSAATETATTTTPETTTFSKKAPFITRPLLSMMFFGFSVSFLFQKLYEDFA